MRHKRERKTRERQERGTEIGIERETDTKERQR